MEFLPAEKTDVRPLHPESARAKARWTGLGLEAIVAIGSHSGRLAPIHRPMERFSANRFELTVRPQREQWSQFTERFLCHSLNLEAFSSAPAIASSTRSNHKNSSCWRASSGISS